MMHQTQTPCFKTMAASLAARAQSYLADQADIGVTEVHAATENVERLRLRPSTTVIGVGGSVGVLIAFSFSQEIISVLYERLTGDIAIPPEEEATYRDAVITEAANVIIGNCTADFTRDGGHISISPPLLLDDTKSIHRVNNALFGTIFMVTPSGSFEIHMIGPKDMFDEQLNYDNGM
jgi:CheY-specific phosphatase CheX